MFKYSLNGLQRYNFFFIYAIPLREKNRVRDSAGKKKPFPAICKISTGSRQPTPQRLKSKISGSHPPQRPCL